MKKYSIITLILFIYSTGGCFGQRRYTHREVSLDTTNNFWLACYDSSKKEIYYILWDTTKPIMLHEVLYGTAGIIQKKQKIDSSKYFYRRFMAERKKGVPDSLNKFKSKLYAK